MNLKLIFIFQLFLISCTWKSDDTLPPGYPFEGGIHELNFRYFDKNKFGRKAVEFLHWSDITMINNKVQCDSITRMECNACNCDELNFDKEILVNKVDVINQVYTGRFDVKVLIDHDIKQVGIQTRHLTESGNSGLNSSFRSYYYNEWLIIPKPPTGYTLNIDY